MPITAGTSQRLRDIGRMWYEVYGFHLTNGQIIDFCLHNMVIGEAKFYLPQAVTLDVRGSVTITAEQHRRVKDLWKNHNLNRDLVLWIVIYQGMMAVRAIYLKNKLMEQEHEQGGYSRSGESQDGTRSDQ